MILILVLAFTEGFFIEQKIVDGKVCERIVIHSSQKSEGCNPIIPRPRGSDTTVLWVDRNHQNAICRTAAIAADGMHILGYWDLNNKRVSVYRTLGNEIPLWSYSGGFPWSYSGHNCGVSNDGHAMTLANDAGIHLWDRASSYPRWIYPFPSRSATVSRDGKRVGAADLGGNLIILDELGDTLWSQKFSEGNRLQGLDISDDGSIVCVTVYDSCFIFENGTVRDRLPIGTSNSGTQYAAKISGDGGYLVTGDYYGRVKLYRWTGSGYNQVWTAQVGNPWITDVGISQDGSTIGCGTGYANGKVCIFDSSSSTPLWQFQGYGSYGAMISSVSLSDNGSRIAVSSWGDTAHVGTFYVCTVHDRSDPTPIIGITRNDEPGSLFAVDISGDGELITTGGKRVHAYEAGNGGEIYALLVGSYYDRNVGASKITNPGRLLKVGEIINPEGGYFNYGDSIETFPVFFEIDDSTGQTIYRDSGQIGGLKPDSSTYQTFSTWTVPAFGWYSIRTYTRLVGDQYPGDDTVSIVGICYHNGAAQEVKPPFAEHTINYQFSPMITVANQGSYDDTIWGIVSITDTGGSEVYRDSGYAYLTPDQNQRLTLTSFQVPYIGALTATGLVRVIGDYIGDDDTLSFPFSGRYEIIYDDGSPEAYYWVGTNENDKFAVRFTPLINPPYFLTGARVYVNRTDPFDYVQLCPDASGLPDTANPILTVNNVQAGQAPGWAIIPFDTTNLPSGDLWVVLHWPQNSPPLGVGADNAPPLDLRSWWYSNSNGWNHWTSHDWMIRMTVEPGIGINDDKQLAFRIGQFAPVPFVKSGFIPFSIPEPTMVRAMVYDPAGRMIRVLANQIMETGVHKVIWDGKDSFGNNRAGVYFIRLEVGKETRNFKVVRIR